VLALLSLHRATGLEVYRTDAERLASLVHRTLGRHRADDVRSGWISGLSEHEGEQHPTAGGLRIGKPLAERAAREPLDPELEWERDGQYFHYLTKWMLALSQLALATGDATHNRHAIELARAAVRAFVRQSRFGALDAAAAAGAWTFWQTSFQAPNGCSPTKPGGMSAVCTGGRFSCAISSALRPPDQKTAIRVTANRTTAPPA
jgi:hypothetical protein